MAFDMNEFRGMFFDEAEAQLAAIEAVLRRIDPARPKRADADAIHRAAHSIKGASASFGFDDMAEVARAMESLFDAVRSGEATLDAAAVDVCLGAWKALRRQLAGHRSGAAADAPEEICERLNAACRSPGAAADGGSGALYELRFSVSRMMAGSEVLIEYMLEKLGTLGVPVVRQRPAGDGGDGEWWVEVRSARPEGELREALDLLIEPGSLRLCRHEPAGETGDATVPRAPEAPASLAAAPTRRVMTVRVAGEVYALPLEVVRASLQPAREAIGGGAGAPTLQAFGECLPAVALGARLEVPGAGQDGDAGVAVVVEADGRPLALLVDGLIDCVEVAVQPLERHYRRAPGFVGAALLEEGRLALVLDVRELAPEAQSPWPVVAPCAA